VLAINRNNTLVVSNDISGSGSVVQEGSGKTIITGNNTYSGGTTINDGILQVGDGGLTGSLGSGNITNYGQLVYNVGTRRVIDNVISGIGSFTQAGNSNSIVILTASNSFSGGTTITNGAH